MTKLFSLPSPAQLLGLPEDSKFKNWYPGQYSLLEKALDWYYSDARFLGEVVGTGGGKSAGALLLHKLTGARTAILTASIGLQQQYMRDAGELGGVLVMGQRNFDCALDPSIKADEGPCHDGIPCELKDQCLYRIQLRRAMDSDLVITNYAYWLAQCNFSSGLGDFDLLCCDEAHQAGAFSAMENYLTIFLARLDVQPFGVNFPESADQWENWRTWADVSTPIAEEQVSRMEAELKQYKSSGSVPSRISRAYRTAKSLVAKLERLSSMSEDWVIQRTYHGYRFVPKWVDAYSGHLFQDVPKVVLMSAILSHKSCDYLGVPKNGQRSWIEMGSQFPPENTPIWHIPTARINYRTDDSGTTMWAARIDQIIQRRLDRKGIIFTVSYERARLLMSRSRFRDIMVMHNTSDVVQVIEKFKQAKSPLVLLSPSVTTGYDFPANLYNIKYLIVGKIPYPDTNNPVTKARHEDDKEWSSYLAMETLIQECGRATRSSADRCEVLLLDDNARWFLYSHKSFAPKWFMARYRGSLDSVPDPLV